MKNIGNSRFNKKIFLSVCCAIRLPCNKTKLLEVYGKAVYETINFKKISFGKKVFYIGFLWYHSVETYIIIE